MSDEAREKKAKKDDEKAEEEINKEDLRREKNNHVYFDGNTWTANMPDHHLEYRKPSHRWRQDKREGIATAGGKSAQDKMDEEHEKTIKGS